MKVFRFFLIFIIILVVLAIGLFYTQFSASQRKAENERFVVAIDAPEDKIVDDLYQKGFIRNKNVFYIFLDLSCWQSRNCQILKSRIQPGAYNVSKSMNVYQLAKTLIFDPYQKWVIVPPGKRKEQVALILQKALNWPFSKARNFIDIAEEGYLFPDTYLIDVNADSQLIVQKFMANFNEKFDEKLQNDLLVQNIRNDTALKIASLIERESGGSEDKPIIAGIIWNRLLKGMKLEIDATVQYAIASEKLDDSGLQTLDDFTFWQILGPGIVRKINSPYNTYLNEGLPPGPICSPSLESIKAVAHPIETDALYYLHSPDKKIHTAKTYKEHLKNIEEFLN